MTSSLNTDWPFDVPRIKYPDLQAKRINSLVRRSGITLQTWYHRNFSRSTSTRPSVLAKKEYGIPHIHSKPLSLDQLSDIFITRVLLKTVCLSMRLENVIVKKRATTTATTFAIAPKKKTPPLAAALNQHESPPAWKPCRCTRKTKHILNGKLQTIMVKLPT